MVNEPSETVVSLKKSTAPKRTLTTMRLPVELMKQLKIVAQRENRSRSNLVEKILRDALTRRKKDDADGKSVFG